MTSKLIDHVLSPKKVAEAFRRGMEEKKPISSVNLGDGEIYFLGYQRVPGFEELNPSTALKYYEKYFTDEPVRDAVLDGVQHANIVAMPTCVFVGTWPKATYFLEYYDIPTERICDSYMGRHLHSTGLLYEMLQHKRVLLLGNHALNLVPFLEKHQIKLAGHTTVDNFEDLPRVKEYVSKVDFDMALVSAGIPTLILAPWITQTLGRCAMDFGCTVDHLN